MSASKLIVLMAFDESADGELVPAFEPKQVETEDRACAKLAHSPPDMPA